MKRLIISFCLLLCFCASAQNQKPVAVFAHNDYVKSNPLTNAYANRADYIEADVFLVDGELLVAHTRIEIDKKKTLEIMYLGPLQQLVKDNGGSAYPETSKALTLAVDLKTDGRTTLSVLVSKLKNYPALIACPQFQIAVSGDVPPPDEWNNYPEFIHFDGRPSIDYSAAALARVALISQSFAKYSKWDGKDDLPEKDAENLRVVIDEVHKKGKRIRMWGSPDTPNAWKTFIKLGIDVINTDRVSEFAEFRSH